MWVMVLFSLVTNASAAMGKNPSGSASYMKQSEQAASPDTMIHVG